MTESSAVDTKKTSDDGKQKGDSSQKLPGNIDKAVTGAGFDFSKLEQTLNKMNQSLEDGRALSVSDQEMLKELLGNDDKQEEIKIKEGRKDEAKKFEELDFEKMSQRDVVTAIMKRIGTEFNSLRSEFKSNLSQTNTMTLETQIKQEIKDTATKYGEEFSSAYKDVMTYAKKHPTLSVEEAFLLHKSSSYRSDRDKLKQTSLTNTQEKASAIMKEGGITDNLRESLKGKSILDTAREIAKQLDL